MDGTLLAILSGRDRPGVTASVFESLTHTRCEVLDIQQIVVRGRLVLAFLLGLTADAVGDTRATLHAEAARLGMEIETVPGASVARKDTDRRRIHVTMMAEHLRPHAVAELARVMAGDENAAPDVSDLLRDIDKLREATGAHVLLVHHIGKDAARGAGTSIASAVSRPIPSPRSSSRDPGRTSPICVARCPKRPQRSGSTSPSNMPAWIVVGSGWS